MKAISLIQPYATLIALGMKNYETRSWATKHAGPLAIHASAGKPTWAKRVALTDPYVKAALDAAGLTWDTLPRGVVLGAVNVGQMHPITYDFAAGLSAEEQAAGDYSFPGRWAWALSNWQPLTNPVPCKGALSLWEIPSDVLAECYMQI